MVYLLRVERCDAACLSAGEQSIRLAARFTLNFIFLMPRKKG